MTIAALAETRVRPVITGTVQGRGGPLVINVIRDWPAPIVTVALPAAGVLVVIVLLPPPIVIEVTA